MDYGLCSVGEEPRMRLVGMGLKVVIGFIESVAGPRSIFRGLFTNRRLQAKHHFSCRFDLKDLHFSLVQVRPESCVLFNLLHAIWYKS